MLNIDTKYRKRAQAFHQFPVAFLFAVSLCLSFPAHSLATPILWSGIFNTGYIIFTAEGTDYVHDSDSSGSGTAVAQTQIIQNDGHAVPWHFDLYAGHAGYHVGYAPQGSMVFNDVIFTDIANPAQTGNIIVSANFWTSGDYELANASLGLRSYLPGAPPTAYWSNMYTATTPANGGFTTSTVSVPLNEPLSFSMYVFFKPFNGFVGNQGAPWRHSYLSSGFDSTPFNLPPGITVNSVDANIVDNAFVVPTPVADLPAHSAQLHQNTPNPFNPSTSITFDLERDGTVSLAIFDVAGRVIRTLVQSHLPAGPHSVRWDGHDNEGRSVSSGIYFSRLRSGSFVATQKMVLAR